MMTFVPVARAALKFTGDALLSAYTPAAALASTNCLTPKPAGRYDAVSQVAQTIC